MKHTWISLCCALLLGLAAGSAHAQHPPITVQEASVETSGGQVHFPATASGQLLVLGCPVCRRQTLQLASDSRFYLNGEPISLAQIRAAARADTPLTIHYRLSDAIVTRVELSVAQP